MPLFSPSDSPFSSRSTRLLSDEDLKLDGFTAKSSTYYQGTAIDQALYNDPTCDLHLSTVRTNLFPGASKSSTILRQSTERAEIPVSVSVPVYERVEYKDRIVTKEVPVTKEVFIDREVRCCRWQQARVPAGALFSCHVF